MNKQKPGPCPFCKSDQTEIDVSYGDDGWVLCTNCGATGPVKPTEAEAIAAWNAPGEKMVALELKRAELQEHLESLTPGGSEFHGGAGQCVEWVRARLATTGKIAAERNELRARVEEMAELCRRAAREMNNLGNLTNWPPEMPMSYAEMINELRAATD